MLDLSAHDPADADLSVEILDPPTQASLEGGAKAWLLRMETGASGEGAIWFRVVTDTVASEPATVKLRYCGKIEILDSPTSTSVCRDRDATLTVQATGERLAYQWLKDGAAIEGAIEPTWTIQDFAADDVGDYAVEVTRWCGDLPQRTRSPEPRVELVYGRMLLVSSPVLRHQVSLMQLLEHLRATMRPRGCRVPCPP